MPMQNSFGPLLGDNVVTRRFGGTITGVAEPYTTGFHYIRFDHLPSELTTYLSEHSVQISSVGEISNILSAACLGVTPPGGTLNKTEFTGVGGIKWAAPANIDYGNTVSVKFLEMSGTPIAYIMHSWVKMIRDYRTGVSSQKEGAGVTKQDYSAVLYYWTTAPDGKTVEYSACYDGVFPAKDPQDLFASDVETVGRLDIEIEFNVDYAWHEPWVKSKCQRLTEAFTASRVRVQTYGNALSS
jgi:hypothetical protein